jgi:hypothetical protein
LRGLTHWTDVRKSRLRAIGCPSEEPPSPW